jgi:hypothetical protein
MLRRMYFNGVSSGFQGRYSDFARIRNVKGAANMPSDFVHMHCVDFTHTHTHTRTQELTRGGAQQKQLQPVARPFIPSVHELQQPRLCEMLSCAL